jgi:hypothetical protein
MNERIRELAEQAHSYACKYAQQPDYNPHNPYNQGMYKQRYDSKFAELIVRECLEIAKNREDEFENAGLLEQSNAVGNVAYRISRQFGVKR